MSGSIRHKQQFDGDDALRELMSSLLSGRYKEETYLWDVSSVCRSRPESAPRLLALIDRYKRLGRMPAAQHQKVKARIEQVMSAIKPASRSSNAHSVTISAPEPLDGADPEFEADDDDSEEAMTREFPAAPNDASNDSVVASREVAASQAAPADTRILKPTQLIPGVIADAMPGETLLLPSAPATASEAPRTTADASASHVRSMPPLSSDPATLGARSSTISIGLGTVLHDRYELKHLLGRGGIATVYKAVDRYRVSLGLEECYVAVKIVQPHPARPGSVSALGREFHNAQLLSHPNVINVFNIDHVGDASFYTMELLDGERLSQIVKRVGVLPRRQALAIIRDVGAAVAHAHSRGVVHADLKPHNIMITTTGQVRVLDFGSGLIRGREPWVSEWSPDSVYRQATPAYASCEQLEGWSADPRDDIYALACLAYLLFTGKHPFNMQPSLDARARRMQPRRPPNLKGESWRALRRGLSWTREQRTMSVEDWLQQLGVSAAVESLPPLAMLEAGGPAHIWLHRAAAAGVLIAGLGLAAFTVEHQDDFDWHPSLARAQDRLSDAWRGIQSLADPPESSTITAAPAAATAAPASMPAPAAAPTTSHKSGGASGHPAAAASLPSRIPSADVSRGVDEKVAMVRPLSSTRMSSADVAQTANESTPAPRLEFSASSYVVPGTEPAARIVIRRNGSTDGDVNFVWWTEEASAKADVDYASLGRRIERIPSGSDKITVYVPIISTPRRQEITQFYVALGEPGSQHSSGPGTRSLVTIDHGD